MITNKSTQIKIETGDLSGKGKIKLVSHKSIKTVVFKVLEEKRSREFVFTYNGNGRELEGEFYIEKPLLWNLSSPHLYTYTLQIVYQDGEERVEGRFGFRSISTNGKEICINGTPVFIRGFIRGATAHDHGNNCCLTEEEFYRKNIRAAKKFGFNFVRFHSVVPSETYFRVADEEGILVHIELRMPTDIYDNLREMTTTGNMLVSDEYVVETVRKLYNHPSLCVYCIGNEIKHLATSDRVDEIYRLIRGEDDTRLFLDTCAWGQNNRPNVDLDVQHLSYYFPFNKHANMYEDTENLLVVGTDDETPFFSEGNQSSVSRELYFNVPLIAHEVCHYTALRDYKALKEKFKKYGTSIPWWIDEELKMIEAKGYANRYDEMYLASKYFQYECWKTAFEAMRRSKLLGGFHFLQFADTDAYENSNGVVDCFDDENVTNAEQFKLFNGDRVLLAELGTRLFKAATDLIVPISLSNCGEDKAVRADFSYQLTDKDGKVYAGGGLKNLDVSRKGLYNLCKLHILLPEMENSEELELSVSLMHQGQIYARNAWRIWVYKQRERLSYKDFVSYAKDNVIVTDNIETAFDALTKGKRVCLMYRQPWTRHLLQKDMPNPEYAFKASWNRFKPVIWDRGTNYGGICKDGLLNKYGFATGRFYDFNMGTISEDCDKINLDDFPCKTEVLISGIDKSCRDRFDAYKDCFNLPELMYDRTLRDYAYLFELSVGAGKLLVCGLNLTGLNEDEVSSQCMANFLLRYVHSADFAPKHGTDIQTLKAYMKECAKKPVKERMMTQFWALDDTPVESKQYWKDSKAYLME